MCPILQRQNEAHKTSEAKCTPHIMILDHPEMRSTMAICHEAFGYVVEVLPFLKFLGLLRPFYLYPFSMGAQYPGDAYRWLVTLRSVD